MQTKVVTKTNKRTTNINSVESLKDLGKNMAGNAVDSIKNLGTGMFDQLMGNFDDDKNQNNFNESLYNKPKAKESRAFPQRKEFTLFNYQEYYESQIVRNQIKELSELIRKEIAMLKKSNDALLNEVSDIENIAIGQMVDKPGIYHVRFLEIVLSILRSFRAKVGESRTWMQVLMSKKKKRGSLFSSRSKKKGTQYSMSQELATARSVQ